jgi:putative transposase
MPRFSRVVIPYIPHHIVQRGNRRQTVFFKSEDFHFFLHLLKKYGDLEGIDIWAYCLMPNHFHLIAAPRRPGSLSRAIGKATWKYAVAINLREDWRGSLWQGRFYSCPLDNPHLIAATRYVERNPVRAGIVPRAIDYPWSSAYAHVTGAQDPILTQNALEKEICDWQSYLGEVESDESLDLIRDHLSTGRPLGDIKFIEKLEKLAGRSLKKLKTGPKRPRQSEQGTLT